MTGLEAFTLAADVAMAASAAGVGLLYRGFHTGKWVRRVGEERDHEIATIKALLERAGRQSSDLASEVQGLPERMREVFVPREIFEVEKAVNRERIEGVRDEMRSEDTKIWNHLRQRRPSN